ncbi:hypothetical protein BsWGS_23837 [Bradybaena similaris]
MRTVWNSIALVMCGWHTTSLVVGDCPYKECQCYGTYINCLGRGLTSMPLCCGTDSTGYLTLTLDSNQITEISAGSLPTGLSEISLIDNPITTIDDNAFDGLSTTLESLYFMNAKFSRIPDAFLHLDSLQHLNIIETKVLDWNVGAMTHIGETLQTFNLEQVGLTAWPVWMAYFQQLNELNVDSNAIASIPDNAFDKLSTSLLTLTLSNNKLTFAPKSLSSLKNLITLDLQNNRISNITWLPQSSKLSMIFLNNNHISDAGHLSSVLRHYAASLSSISLSFNQLTVIPDLSFMTMMYGFDLSHNHISDPNSGTLHNGTYGLDLSFNLLPSIPTVYKDLKLLTLMSLSHNIIRVVQSERIPVWVTNLDLQFNLITELSDTSFPENAGLEVVTLDNNPLATVSNSAFKNLAFVNNLSLQNTKLTRLPLSLTYLTSIRYLDLNDNSDLVCTCLEKSLKTTITSDIYVSGDCGYISIYEFMATLSSDCPQ